MALLPSTPRLNDFKLPRKLYMWAPQDVLSPARFYDLVPELEDWLNAMKVTFTTRTERVVMHSKTFLYHYINIPDDQQAMLFKLAWMGL